MTLHLGGRVNFLQKLGNVTFFCCPADICRLKVNNKNTRTRCEICSKVTLKTPIGVILVSLLLTWTYFTLSSSVSVVNFEHVNAGWLGNDVTAFKIETKLFPDSVKFCVSHKNRSFNFQYKPDDWFLYELQYWVEMGQKTLNKKHNKNIKEFLLLPLHIKKTATEKNF